MAIVPKDFAALAAGEDVMRAFARFEADAPGLGRVEG